MAEYQCVGGPRDGEVHDLPNRPEHGMRVYISPPPEPVSLAALPPTTIKMNLDVYTFVRFEGDGEVVWLLAPEQQGMTALKHLLAQARH